MEQKKGYFPLFVNIDNKRIVVIGAGKIALRRIETLLQFPCHLVVIAPQLCDKILEYYSQGLVDVINREFQLEDVEAAYIIIAATNNENVNNRIYELCKEKNILVNHVGNKDKCDFYFPGIIKKEEIVIGVTASGSNHELAKKVTSQIKEVSELF